MNQLLNVKEKIIEFINLNKPLVFKILAILIIIITIFTIKSVLKKEKVGNTAGNLYSNGISAIDGKWIYYMEFDDNEPFAIYRVKKNGEKKEKIIEGNFEYINVYDSYIYCLEKNQEKNEYNLIKMKTNGNKKEVLAKNVDKAPVTVTQKKVFYLKDNKLHTIKTNGSDKEKLTDKEVTYYHISGKVIYYIYENEGDSYLARMKTNGKKNIRIGRLKNEEKAKYKTVQIKGNKIYYITEEKTEEGNKNLVLYKMNKNGEKQERLYMLPDYVQIINMQEDAIYYIVKEDEYKLYRMNYKTGKRELMKKMDKLKTINVSGKWVFYITEEDSEIVIKRINLKGSKEQNL